MMIDAPSLVIRMVSAGRGQGDHSPDDAKRLVERWLSTSRDRDQAQDFSDAVTIRIDHDVPRHVGFGSGTQMACAVAVGLSALRGEPLPTPLEIAKRLSRGRRSGLGLHGFFLGGFLVDRGTADEGDVSPLELRMSLPTKWRCVVVTPRGVQGPHGHDERHAFSNCPAATNRDRDRAVARVRDSIVPALARGSIDDFGEALHEFNRESGLPFRGIQQGIYSHRLTQSIVDFIRQRGTPGAVQSSWGPTVAVVVADEIRGHQLAHEVSGAFENQVDCRVTSFNQTGAHVRVLSGDAAESATADSAALAAR